MWIRYICSRGGGGVGESFSCPVVAAVFGSTFATGTTDAECDRKYSIPSFKRRVWLLMRQNGRFSLLLLKALLPDTRHQGGVAVLKIFQGSYDFYLHCIAEFGCNARVRWLKDPVFFASACIFLIVFVDVDYFACILLESN